MRVSVNRKGAQIGRASLLGLVVIGTRYAECDAVFTWLFGVVGAFSGTAHLASPASVAA